MASAFDEMGLVGTLMFRLGFCNSGRGDGLFSGAPWLVGPGKLGKKMEFRWAWLGPVLITVVVVFTVVIVVVFRGGSGLDAGECLGVSEDAQSSTGRCSALGGV